MGLWKRSIQWQLILSMGAALLTSILIVVGVYSAVVNRLTERFLVEEALPARALAIRNDLERVLTAPITANAGIAANTFIQDWLAAGEPDPGGIETGLGETITSTSTTTAAQRPRCSKL